MFVKKIKFTDTVTAFIRKMPQKQMEVKPVYLVLVSTGIFVSDW